MEENRECFVLKNTDTILKKSTAATDGFKFKLDEFVHKRATMALLCAYLENFLHLPVVDQTNLQEIYDIELNWNYKDEKTLHAALKKYGLTIEKPKEQLPVKVLAISRKNNVEVPQETLKN